MKVYISGPITANPNYVEEFKKVEETLSAAGHEVINPVEITRHLLDKGLSPAELWRQCMIEDIKALKKCDAIVLLDRKGLLSRGMDIEIKTAVNFDIRIFTLDNFLKNISCFSASLPPCSYRADTSLCRRHLCSQSFHTPTEGNTENHHTGATARASSSRISLTSITSRPSRISW